ncbi:MAG: hypothetical protein M4579_003448 [Chaenotheca gracillima]|nr:MAG: hypothetical protein M4579_003448 [Chaenotheca gracillima]
MPTSFASAAAGNTASDGSSATRVFSRGDGAGSGDWSRSRANGAGPTTFRRPSQPTPTPQQQQQQQQPQGQQQNSTSNNSNLVSSPGVYVPPHHQSGPNLRNGSTNAARFGKDQLLQMYKSQRESGGLHREVPGLVMGDWSLGSADDSGGSPWSKRDDKDGQPHAPTICWDPEGNVIPLGLLEMSEEEREHYMTSVNSLLKPPQSANKDPNAPTNGPVGRKSSISQGSSAGNAFNLASPTSGRPTNRRRETSDSIPYTGNPLASPTSSKFTRDPAPQPPRSMLSRRRTDFREENPHAEAEKEEAFLDSQAQSSPGLPNLIRRSTTGPLSANANAPSSPWSAAGGASGGGSFSPMGSFGNFGLGDSPSSPLTPGEKRPGFGSVRGGSRLSKFMGQDSWDESHAGIQEKSSIGSLGKVSESEAERFAQGGGDGRSHRPMSGETDPFGEGENQVGGSAVLGGRQDDSPPQYQRMTSFGPNATPSRGNFGMMDSNLASRLPGFMDANPDQGQQSDHREQHQGGHEEREPLSPTETNPYQSPASQPADPEDIDTDGSEIQNLNHPGLSGLTGDHGYGHGGGMPRGGMAEIPPSDRSQASSTGPNRGFSNRGLGGLSGIGGLSGWPASAGPSGLDKDNSGFGGAFGKSVFSPMEGLNSPNQAGMSGSGFFGGHGTIGGGSGTIGRGSKLGSLFPPAMQAQMQGRDGSKQPGADDDPDDASRTQSQFPSGLGHGFPGPRDTDSPLRSGRGVFDDLGFSGLEGKSGAFSSDNLLNPNDVGLNQAGQSAESTQGPGSAALPNQTQTSQGPSPSGQPLLSPGGNGSQNLPQNQQRTMVMPDRMRWIYQDPQGKTQGPWSGLEMHDWFKAGFFGAELLVKRIEEDEFLPLGQLIRQIGNSREPFLVPRIGIPHGPPGAPGAVQWNAPPPPTGVNPPPAQGGAVQPPFASAFPSFGTTLTAEQQNNLERRKQEEQYLMARQKEWLAQKQYNPNQIHPMPPGPTHPTLPQQLHHHSSAHSLQSQPSYGSITSPGGGFHQTPPQGPIQPPQSVSGLFDPQSRQSGSIGIGSLGSTAEIPALQNMRDDEIAALMARANLNRDSFGPGSGAFGQQPENQTQQSQVAAIMSQRAQLHREQQEAMQGRGPIVGQDSMERLQQFNELRANRGDDSSFLRESVIEKPGGARQQGDMSQELRAYQQDMQQQSASQLNEATAEQGKSHDQEPQILSLTQQVQKAASAKQSPAPGSQPESAWGRDGKGAIQPPAHPVSPLPAPAAQRNRQNLPDALTVESSSRSETPSGELSGAPASIAPWAKENQEGSRGPSLKEIQEAEARKAAKAEEAAVAARRALSEQERQHQVTIAPAPGLPASSTWASATTPVTPASSGPAWTVATPGKTTSGTTPGGTKKTLQQIQREEESRKQKVTGASATSASANPAAPNAAAASAGKRYADLAGKIGAAQIPNVGGAWTTVGAGGKTRTPSGAAPAAPPPGLRVASSSTVPTVAGAGRAKPALAPTRSTTMGGPLPGQINANEEFTKWAKGALSKGLNSNINVDDFVQQLLMFPPESEIISESVYANSQTMDGRRFAEEYLRRRKLADKGLVDSSSPAHGTNSPSGSAYENKAGLGGWSEVSKKGNAAASSSTPKEAEAFKVVAPKKKGKR